MTQLQVILIGVTIYLLFSFLVMYLMYSVNKIRSDKNITWYEWKVFISDSFIPLINIVTLVMCIGILDDDKKHKHNNKYHG